METKSEKVNHLIIKLKNIANKALEKKAYNELFASVSFAAETLYMYNQFYTDDELEKLTQCAGDMIKNDYGYAGFSASDCSEKIIFYDGFGLDTRGVALMHLNAHGLNSSELVYVTNINCKDKIPTIQSVCQKNNFTIKYVNMDNYFKWAIQLAEIFEEYKPKAAFFYTKPHDCAAAAVFSMYRGIVKRYLIDLTDHAFWLGKCANDYFCGSREMSAYVLTHHRGVSKDKCIKLGVNLIIPEIDDHNGLPFNPLSTRYIFSGGALYKTLGDENLYYYRIVDHILDKHEDMYFLFAGAGDDSEMVKLKEKYPNRAYHIQERQDFYYLIQHCVFYLNTYPMFGGMMMKYAAHAGKLPITLRHGYDADGLLMHQKECQIEYDSYDELIEDVDKLLTDNDYLQEREHLMEGSVITESRFKNNLKGVIDCQRTDYEHSFVELDTTEFRKEFYERFDYNQNLYAVARKQNISLMKYFPKAFIYGVPKKTLKRFYKEKNK